MKKEYEDYFQSRLDLIARNSNFPEIRNFNNDELRSIPIDERMTLYDVIQKAILEFEYVYPKEVGITIRDDAKLFLFMNFSIMVYEPLSITENRFNLLKNIYNDVVVLLRKALDSTREKRSYEISSHEMIMAGISVWNNLRTLFQDSW